MGSRVKRELAGQVFGRWSVLARAEGSGKARWICRCECGTEKVVLEFQLISGASKSCRRGDHKPKWKTPGFSAWSHMVQRCTNPNNNSYSRYGGRGISVCDRWLDSFDNFHADMGPPPEGTSLDRIDNSRGYEPGNCRWATAEEQQNNTRRNVLVEFEGEVYTLSQLAKATGIPYATLQSRHYRGRPLL